MGRLEEDGFEDASDVRLRSQPRNTQADRGRIPVLLRWNVAGCRRLRNLRMLYVQKGSGAEGKARHVLIVRAVYLESVVPPLNHDAGLRPV